MFLYLGVGNLVVTLWRVKQHLHTKSNFQMLRWNFSHSFVLNAQICYRCGAFEQALVKNLMTCYKCFICSLQGNHIFAHTWNMFTNVMRHHSCVVCIVYEGVFHWLCSFDIINIFHKMWMNSYTYTYNLFHLVLFLF